VCDRDPQAAFGLPSRAIELGDGQARGLLESWKAEEAARGE
jgi:hypothetical protein